MPGERMPAHRVGRPDAEASHKLDGLILETAERLFAEQGFAATSMEQIATAAGSGKQTIYRRYPSKKELFRAVVTTVTGRLVAVMVTTEGGHDSSLATLRQACRATLDFVCKPEVISLYRMLIAEAGRFPDLVADAMHDAKGRHEEIIHELVAAAREMGEIKATGETDTLVHALSGLITGWAMARSLVGLRDMEDAAVRAAYFETAWSIFLQGVTAKPVGSVDMEKEKTITEADAEFGTDA